MQPHLPAARASTPTRRCATPPSPACRSSPRCNTELFQDEKLYARVKAAQPAEPAPGQAQEGPPRGLRGQRRRACRRTSARAPRRSSTSSRSCARPSTATSATTRRKVTFTPAEMEGMPEAYLKAHRSATQKGNYVLRARLPVVLPVHGEREERRRRASATTCAKFTQGGEDNLDAPRRDLQAAPGARGPLRAAELRRVRAAPQDGRHAAQTVEQVPGRREGRGRPISRRRSIEELRAEKAKDLGTPLADTKLERWDVVLLPGEGARGALRRRPGEAAQVLPDGQVGRLRARSSRRRLYGVKFREAKVPGLESRRALLRRARREDRHVPLRLLPRPLSRARASTATRRPSRMRGASTARQAHAARGAGGQPRPQRASTRTSWRRCMHEFGHVLHGVLSRDGLRPRCRHRGEDRLRRGALADVRGMGAPRAAAGALPRRSARIARTSPTTRSSASRPPAATARASLYARQWLLRDASTWRSRPTRARRWRSGRRSNPPRRWATSREPCSRPSFSHIAEQLRRGLLRLHVVARCSRSTCSRRSRSNMLDPDGRRALPRHHPRRRAAQDEETATGARLPRARALERRVLRGDHREALNRCPPAITLLIDPSAPRVDAGQ